MAEARAPDVTLCAGPAPLANLAKCLPLSTLAAHATDADGRASKLVSALPGAELAPPAQLECMLAALHAANGASAKPLASTPRGASRAAHEPASAALTQLRQALGGTRAQQPQPPPPRPAAPSTSGGGSGPASGSLVGTPVRRRFPGFGVHDGTVEAELEGGRVRVLWDDATTTTLTRAGVDKFRTDAAQGASPVPGRGARAPARRAPLR